MSHQTVRIVDPGDRVVATAQVAQKDGTFTGSIDLRAMPPELLRRFETYEEIVKGQMFSLLDEVETQIRALSLVVIFGEGRRFPVEDLQIYPKVGRVSFELARAITQPDRSTSYADVLDVALQAQAETRDRG